MLPSLTKLFRKLPVAALCLLCTVAFALPMSAQADGKGKGHNHSSHNQQKAKNKGKQHANKNNKKKNHDKKARTTICHYNVDGTYSTKSLPVHAAMKHLAKHDLDKEPTIAADGSESCGAVVVDTTCKVNVNGTPTTVAEFLASQNVSNPQFSTDSNSCDLGSNGSFNVSLFANQDGAGLDIFFFPGNHSLLINSAEQYDDCAFDIETAAGTNQNCIDWIQLNDGTLNPDSPANN